MKNKLVISLCTLMLTSEAFAGSFSGSLGPFQETESSVATFQFRICDQSLKEIQFFVEKKGKYHMPRINLDFIKIRYSSGFEDVFDGTPLGETRNFTIALRAGHGCPTELTMKAQAAGFIPTGKLMSTVGIWTY